MDRDGVLSGRERLWWRVIQIVVWLLGLGIFTALLVEPAIGIHAFWNVLIPLAPAILVFIPGIWRNICPLASTTLLARHLGTGSRLRISPRMHGLISLGGVVLLLLIVPLRHVVLDTSGPATALTIAALALLAITMGLLFEWKSGWCTGLCPVHPVEKLYGQSPIVRVSNAHCTRCQRCVEICADSTPELHPLLANKTRWHKVAGILMVGGFAGFIWGWFHVPDYAPGQGWAHLGFAYAMPMGAAAVTLALFLVLRGMLGHARQGALVRVFAAAAVACYYWYRLPALFGFGLIPGDGMLVDLSGTLPPGVEVLSHAVTTGVLLWWLAFRSSSRRTWAIRPAYAHTD
jgi:ferredoxin